MISFSNGSDFMKLPDLNEARKRSSKEILIKTNDFSICYL